VVKSKSSGSKVKLEQSVDSLSRNVRELTFKLEQFCGMLGVVSGKVEAVQNFVGRVTFPAEAINALTGELRVFRHLLDKAGEFKHMDREVPASRGEGGLPASKGVGAGG
jgi:hypothetical protein